MHSFFFLLILCPFVPDVSLRFGVGKYKTMARPCLKLSRCTQVQCWMSVGATYVNLILTIISLWSCAHYRLFKVLKPDTKTDVDKG